MSLIVAIKKDDVVYLGADTRTTSGERVRSNLAQSDLKIHRMGACYVGAAGTVSNIQLMINHPEWFELNGEPLSKRFIVHNIIPKYYDLAKEMEKLDVSDKNGNGPNCGCGFIVTDGKKLFEIYDNFEVAELSRYTAVGCTDRIALTLMLNALDDYSPEEIILKALRMSAYRNNGVGAPYVLVNTRDNEFIVVEE